MSGLKIWNVENGNKKYRYLYPAVVYAVLAAMFAAYFSVFETELSRPLVYGSMAAAVACLGILEGMILGSRKQVRKAGFAVIGAAFAGLSLGYRLWAPGLSSLVNGYIVKYNEFYGTGLSLMEKTEGAAAFAALFAVQFLLGAILLGILVNGRFVAAAVPVILLPGILEAFVGYMPSPLAAWGLLAAGCLFVMAGHSKGGRGWFLELAVGMLVLVILYGCTAWASPSLRQYVAEHEQNYTGIREALLQAQELNVGAMLAEHVQGESNYSKRGVGKGDFRNLSEHHPQGTKELEVIVTEKPTSRVYLRAFVGTEYTNTGWNEMSGVRFAKVAAPVVGEGKKKALLSEPFRRIYEGSGKMGTEKMSIRRFGASREFGYPPYYAQIPDNLTVRLDAYVKGNGRKEWEYEYYPRQAAERTDADELAEESSLWAEYGAFVEETYKELPQGLDRLKQYCSRLDQTSVEQVGREIDSEFASRLSYSLEPGNNPADKDFAEYFLFENQKGFCVHFATAAALIYRECGYASRYVEGYAVSPEEFGEQSDGTYRAVVTDEMAHAWCETFDSELGWQMREHTLPYTADQSQPEILRAESSRTDTADREENGADSSREEGSGEAEPNQQEDPEENQNAETDDGDPEGETTGEEGTDDRGKNEAVTKEGDSDGPSLENGSGAGGTGNGKERAYVLVKRVLFGMGCAALTIGFLWILGFVWYRFRRQRKLRAFRKRKDHQGIANIYAEIYQICVFLGMKDPGLCERELGEKWKRKFPYLAEEEWEWLCDCAVKAAFSKEKPGKEEWTQMYKLYQKFRRAVLAELKGKKRWLFLYGKAM